MDSSRCGSIDLGCEPSLENRDGLQHEAMRGVLFVFVHLVDRINERRSWEYELVERENRSLHFSDSTTSCATTSGRVTAQSLSNDWLMDWQRSLNQQIHSLNGRGWIRCRTSDWLMVDGSIIIHTLMQLSRTISVWWILEKRLIHYKERSSTRNSTVSWIMAELCIQHY